MRGKRAAALLLQYVLEQPAEKDLQGDGQQGEGQEGGRAASDKHRHLGWISGVGSPLQ